MNEIKVGVSRARMITMLIGALCFVAGGIFLLVIGDEPWIAWMNIIFFGGGALVFARQIADNRPRLVIDARGVYDRTLNVGVIEWPDIVDATTRRIQGNAFICLHLRDPAKYTAHLSPMMLRMVEMNRKLGFTELSLNLSGTNVDPEQLRELIIREVAVRQLDSRA